MNQSQILREQIEREIQKVAWDALEPHVMRDALILVDPTLELTEVAIAATEDCKDLMELWVDRGWLSKPNSAQLETLKAQPEQRFDFVVVQPFVFARQAQA